MKRKRLSEAEVQKLATPDGFAEHFLGMELYPKQRKVLREMMPIGARVTFKACNEAGKTSRVITALILWHLYIWEKGQIKSTSGSWNQIETQLVPKLQSYSNMFPGWNFLRKEIQTDNPNRFWRGISTKEPGRFEGAHEDSDAPLLIIVDEAKTVPDLIFQAIERCRPTRLLLASSTGASTGEFYRSHTDRSKFYTSQISMTVDECPHIPADHVERTVEKWGKEHPLVRSMFFAEFMAQTDDMVFNLANIERAIADPPTFEDGEQRGFCDFAAGRAENVFALRRGNRITMPDIWTNKDTMATVGRFLTNFRKFNLKPEEVEGDADGLGKPICDAMREAGFPIGPFHGGAAPRYDDHYGNLWAEAWFELALAVDKGKVILPDDMDLKGQLTSRKRRYNAKGKLCLETKEEMAGPGRNLPSPDRGDAVCGAWLPNGNARGFNLIHGEDAVEEYNKLLLQDGEQGRRKFAGFDAY